MIWLLRLKPWHFLVITVIFVEVLTALMSIFFRGRVTYDYLISGGVVSFIVASLMIFLFSHSSRLQFEKNFLQKEIDERTKAENLLKVQAQIIDILKDSLVTTDLEGFIATWNRGAEKLFGIPGSEAIGKHISFVYPQDEHAYLRNIISNLKELGQYESEVRMQRKSGQLFHALLSLSMIYDENGIETGMLGYAIDISERKAMEEALRKSEEIYRAVVNASPLGIHICDIKGKITLSNPAHHRIFEAPEGALIGKYLWELVSSDADKEYLKDFFNQLPEEQPVPTQVQSINRTFTGKLIDVKVNWDYIRDVSGKVLGFCSVVEDITEKKKTEDALNQALKDKDLLIREVHHRVKNNLAVIQSLLKLQSFEIKDEEALVFFRESQSRVKAMSMIHERLYRSDDLSSIDLAEYVRSLALQIFNNYRVDRSRIRLHLAVPQISLDIDTVIPCGLILNELVSNALKYAFPDNRAGVLSIEVISENSNECTLIVKDNGVGMPENFDIYQTESFGIQLASSLANQIKGRLEMHRNGGTEFTLTFKTTLFKNNPA